MFDQIQPFLMLGVSNMFLNKDDNLYNSIFKGLIVLFIMKCYEIVNHLNIEQKISNYIREYFYSFNKKNIFLIKLCSHEIIIRNSNLTSITKKLYSDTFLSIIHYISTHKLTVKNINNYQEILTNCITNDWSEKEKNKFTLFPLQNEEIILDKINKHSIYCIINKKQTDECEEKLNDSKNSSNSSTKKIEIYVELFCYMNKNNSDAKEIEELLHNFIKKCETDYIEFICPENNTAQYIHTYEKSISSDEGFKEVKFKDYLFESNKDLDKNVFFEDKDKLINYITPFIFNKNNKINEGELLYSKLGKTYSAGILLSGPPGCGKSSTIKAILKKTNRNGVIINLSSIKSNEELEDLFRNRTFKKKTYKGTQLAFIIEDCDADQDEALLDRSLKNDSTKMMSDLLKNNDFEYKKEKDKDLMSCVPLLLMKQTFDLNCFLNILDGIIELHGVMVIMTTNYKEKLDKALIRDGRIDFKIEFKKASKQVIKDILKLKFDVDDISIDKIPKFKEIRDYILSPATIQSISFKSSTLEECITQILYECQEPR